MAANGNYPREGGDLALRRDRGADRLTGSALDCARDEPGIRLVQRQRLSAMTITTTTTTTTTTAGWRDGNNADWLYVRRVLPRARQLQGEPFFLRCGGNSHGARSAIQREIVSPITFAPSSARNDRGNALTRLATSRRASSSNNINKNR